ncbi:MAG: hypothetical protein COB60_07305 [Flavobacteriaceae bacterium]|nr:MAG: hypothetical protein COB60_07305 [Flavobacteriaceae bacterium]
MILSSCEEVQTPDLGTAGKQWLQFGATNFQGNEADGKILVTVQLAADTNPTDLSIDFSILETSNTQGYTIEPSSGTIIIPAGELEAVIEITPIDNNATNDNISIKLALSENTSYPLGLLGEGLINHETTVTILDDDCTLDLSEFYGTYLANEDGYCDGCYEVVISEGPVEGTLLMANLYETGGTTVVELDNSDPSNPFIIYRSSEFGAVIQNHGTYGPGMATGSSDIPTSTFRTCDKYMDLYFKRCFDAGCFAYNHIQLTRK